MKNIIITTDSSADLPLHLREQFGGVQYMHIPVTLEGRTGRDGVDIFPEDILAAFNAHGVLPKTAAPSPTEYRDFFEQHTAQGTAVVHVSLNSKYSSCYEFACQAAQEAAGEVHVVDSHNFSIGQGLLCLHACELRAQGSSAQEIAAQVEQDRTRVKMVCYLHNLDFAVKSGRVPALAALAATLLNLHPGFSLDGNTGATVPGKKYRGKNAAELWLRDSAAKFAAECDGDLCLLLNTPDVAPEVYRPMLDLAAQQLGGFARLHVGIEAGCTIFSHSGGNCWGMAGMMRAK